MNRLFLFIIILLTLSCKKTEIELSKSEDQKSSINNINNEFQYPHKPLIDIETDDTLMIWVRADGAPGMFLNQSGELQGFYVDLERAVMKEMGQKYELHPYFDLGPLLQKLKSGEAHVALSTPDLPDYRSFLNLSYSFEVLDFVIFLHKSNNDIIPQKRNEAINYLYNKKIGVQTRGHIYQDLRTYKDINLIEYPTTTSALEALHRGEVDAVPDVKRIGQYYIKNNKWDIKAVGETLLSVNICTSFSKALNPSVRDRYNTALKKLIDSGYVKKLYSDYFEE